MRQRGLLLLLFVVSIHLGTAVPAEDEAAPPGAMLDLTRAVVVTPGELSGPEKRPWRCWSRRWIEGAGSLGDRYRGSRCDVLHRGGTERPLAGQPSSAGGVARPRTRTERAGGLSDRDGGEGAGRRRRRATMRAACSSASGRLLRELQDARGRVLLPGDFRVATAPRFPLRGHQLGYRPKTNSYDGWDLDAVGTIHPRPGRLRHQRHRADPAALRRCRRQPPFPAAADRHDDRDVATGRRVRHRRLDLVSGHGPRLLQSRPRSSSP